MSTKKPKHRTSTLVYSTDTGRLCPGCNKPLPACVCKKKVTDATADGVVRLFRESKGRKGKGVTLVQGLALSDAEIFALAKQLKSACGVGGSVKSGVIELQTAEREKIKTLLEATGFTVKIAGG